MFLLWTYLFATLGFYLVLRYVIRNREKFAFLDLDSPRGIRESTTYKLLAQKAGFLVPCLIVCVLLYLGLSVFEGTVESGNLWRTGGLLTLGGAGILALTRDPRNNFCLALIYSAGLVITFAMETSGPRHLMFGITLHHVSDILFSVIGCLVLLKTFFRQDGDFYLSTIDFLLLGISIILAALFFEIPSMNFLLTPFLKGVTLFLAIKVVSNQGAKEAGVMVFTVLSTTLFLSLRGFLMWQQEERCEV